MNKLVIIPVCNFIDVLNKIVNFYIKYLDEADIIIVDDSDGDITINRSFFDNNEKNIRIIKNKIKVILVV